MYSLLNRIINMTVRTLSKKEWRIIASDRNVKHICGKKKKAKVKILSTVFKRSITYVSHCTIVRHLLYICDTLWIFSMEMPAILWWYYYDWRKMKQWWLIYSLMCLFYAPFHFNKYGFDFNLWSFSSYFKLAFKSNLYCITFIYVTVEFFMCNIDHTKKQFFKNLIQYAGINQKKQIFYKVWKVAAHFKHLLYKANFVLIMQNFE